MTRSGFFGGPAACLATALAAVFSTPASAAGPVGMAPSSAQMIALNTTYSGNDGVGVACPTGGCYNFWQLPALLKGDAVTIAEQSLGSHQTDLCLTGNVNDSNWGKRSCKIDTDYKWYTTGDTLQNAVFVTRTSAVDAYVLFGNEETEVQGAAYQFDVLAIRHEVDLEVTTPSKVTRSSTLHGSAMLTSGKPAEVELPVTLDVTWKGGAVQRRATVHGGRLSWSLRLPASAAGKQVNVQAVLAESSDYRKSASAKTTVVVAA